MQKIEKVDQLSIIGFGLLIALSTLVIAINAFYWHYTTVNYFAEGMGGIFFFLLFSMLGSYFSKGPTARMTQIFFYILLYHCVVCSIMYATMAVQFTPFTPTDTYWVAVDKALGYDLVGILDKLANYPEWRKILSRGYNFIDSELLVLPIALIIMGQIDSIKVYFYLLLSTTIIGYCIYFFWPTMAPASILKSAYFLNEQRNTGIKFSQVHQALTVDSNEGGMISMPSFHIIWALLCQHSMWRVKWLWWGLLPMNILVVIASLVLGWHYLADFIGSVLVIGLAYGILLMYGWLFSVVRFQCGQMARSH